MGRIERLPVRIATVRGQLASVAPGAGRVFLGLVIVQAAEGSQIVQRIRAAVAPRLDMIDDERAMMAPAHDASVLVAGERGFPKVQPLARAVERVTRHGVRRCAALSPTAGVRKRTKIPLETLGGAVHKGR